MKIIKAIEEKVERVRAEKYIRQELQRYGIECDVTIERRISNKNFTLKDVEETIKECKKLKSHIAIKEAIEDYFYDML